ncbi:MAG: RNA-binding S4 domain-containing protein [Paludibacteraceae bacterium]|nr:RNA-binding S4 domain-containing protein [Paludibacteraceae bacterium]
MLEVRIDKFLWEIRQFKTRTLAADSCKNGKVRVNKQAAKPSRNISIGDVVEIRKGAVLYEFLVLQLPNGRVSAKLLPQYIEDRTDLAQLEMLQIARSTTIYRPKGVGRPTKKERRDLENYFEGEF